MSTIAELSSEPKYTIKTVCAQTGIRAVTLRAWERRYALLNPQRGENLYRRYSEQDIAVLRWIKSRVDGGLAISTAAQELKTMLQRGMWPEPVPSVAAPVARTWRKPPQDYASGLYSALVNHNELTAAEILQESQGQFDLDTLCLQIILPCLRAIGDAWERGAIRVATEHFASTFLRGKLHSIFQAYPLRRSTPVILCGCAPGELHEIGSLIFATMLRRDGYRVEYLGPDLPLEDLVEYARYAQPDMICLAATMEENALGLRRLQPALEKLKNVPTFGFGGGAFNRQPALRESVPGVFLGEDLLEASETVHKLLRDYFTPFQRYHRGLRF